MRVAAACCSRLARPGTMQVAHSWQTTTRCDALNSKHVAIVVGGIIVVMTAVIISNVGKDWMLRRATFLFHPRAVRMGARMHFTKETHGGNRAYRALRAHTTIVQARLHCKRHFLFLQGHGGLPLSPSLTPVRACDARVKGRPRSPRRVSWNVF